MALYNYLVSNGVIIEDTSSIRSMVESQYKTIFGDDLDTSSQTLQGALINSDVEILTACVAGMTLAANQINPNFSTGMFLDGVMALTGDKRKKGESDAEARRERKAKLGLLGHSTIQNIKSNLLAVAGVQSVAIRQNDDNVEKVIDGLTMPPHSVWACINGGTQIDIAKAYLKAKSVGVAFFGSRTQEITEYFSGQRITVKFDRPNKIPLKIKIGARSDTIATDITETVRGAILEYATTSFAIGEPVSPFELAAAVNEAVPNVFIKRVEVGKLASGTTSTDTLQPKINELPTIEIGNIEIDTE